MGHSTIQVTEHDAHLKPELFGAADRATLKGEPRSPQRHAAAWPSRGHGF
jgi:hypothetical protein